LKKFSIILPDLRAGGAQRVALNIASEIDSNINVELILLDKIGEYLDIIPKHISIHNLSKKRILKSIIPLIKLLNKLNPDIIFSTLGHINIILLMIKPFINNKSQIWIREANMPSLSIPNWDKSFIIKNLYKLLYPFADKLICSSNQMKKEFVNNYNISSDKVYVLYNPVKVNEIRLKAKNIIKKDIIGQHFVTVGSLDYQKGIDRLITYMNKIKNKSSHLTIIGTGHLKNELQKMVDNYNLNDNVSLIGYCSNPYKWIAGADAFLLSSRWEGMPNVVLESLACSTDVIATTECGAVSEIIDNNHVIIVNAGEEYLGAMNNVSIKNKTVIGENLLNSNFNISNVMPTVENWINEL